MPRKQLAYALPSAISGLTAWFKADSLSLNDGDAIASWTDSSGNSNTATQATGANQPAYKKSIINGLPVARFDGGDGLVVANASNFDLATPSIFIVSKRTGGSSTGTMMAKATTAFGQDPRRRKLQIRFNGSTTFQYFSGADADLISGTTTDTSIFNIYGVVANSNASHALINNGTSTTDTTALSDSTFNTVQLIIGSAFGAGTEGMTGDIAEIIYFNKALSTDEQLSIQNYLGSKYNIQSETIGMKSRPSATNRVLNTNRTLIV